MFITKTSRKSKAIQSISLRKGYESDFKNLDKITELYIIKHKIKSRNTFFCKSFFQLKSTFSFNSHP